MASRSQLPGLDAAEREQVLPAPYPEVRDALAEQSRLRFAVDGEIVAFDHGQTSFARLAQRRRHAVAVFYYVFDLLWLDGLDTRALAYGRASVCCATRWRAAAGCG